MATNIEIKARVYDRARLLQRVAALKPDSAVMLEQVDTFYLTPHGRLKLRTLGPAEGQLVYYEREDAGGPRPSQYEVYYTQTPSLLGMVLGQALGVRGTLRKKRWLFMVGQTRVHVDQVEDLGDFVELEVVLQPGQSHAQGRTIAEELMGRLGIQEKDLVDVAYIDLLEAPGPVE